MSAIVLRRLGSVRTKVLSSWSTVAAHARRISEARPTLPKLPSVDPCNVIIGMSGYLIVGALCKQRYDFYKSEQRALEQRALLQAQEETTSNTASQFLEADMKQKERLGRLEDELETKMGLVAGLQEDVQRLSKKVQAAEALRNEKVEQITQLKSQIETLTNAKVTEINELKTQVGSAEALASEKLKEISELKSQVHATDALSKEKATEMNAMKSQAQSTAAEKLNELKSQADLSEAERSQLQQKIAMVEGIFSLENKISSGESIENEVAVLQGFDTLIDAAIAKVPQEALKNGVLTAWELQTKLLETKPMLLEVLRSSDSNAIKVQEDNVLKQVDSYVKERKFAEAADVLERSVQGTKAETVVSEWAKQARMRATVDQLNEVLRASVAMSI